MHTKTKYYLQYLSKDLNCTGCSAVRSPSAPRQGGGRRAGSTVTPSAGMLTKLRRMSFTLTFFETGTDGAALLSNSFPPFLFSWDLLTSKERVHSTSLIASGPALTLRGATEDATSVLLPTPAAVSSPMPESLLRADDVLSDSSTDAGVNGLDAAVVFSTSYPETTKKKYT